MKYNLQLKNEKSAQRDAITVRWRSQNYFAPASDPLPEAQDGQNLISWNYLYLQTQFGEDRCMQF